MALSPFAGPGERKYPDDLLDQVEVTDEARELAADLHHEAQTKRIVAIIQLYLNRACQRAAANAASAPWERFEDAGY